MGGLKGYFEKRVMTLLGRPLKAFEYDVFEVTLEAVEHKARDRVRVALMKGLGVTPAGYVNDVALHTAVDHLTNIAVSAVLQNDPTTDQFDATIISELLMAGPLQAGKSGLPAVSKKQQSPVTLGEIQGFLDEIKSWAPAGENPVVSAAEKEQWLATSQAPHILAMGVSESSVPPGAYQGQTKMVGGGVQKIWNGTDWVTFEKPKHGKSKSLFEPDSPPPALDELLERTTDRAKDLKAKRLRDAVGAKYEELTGKTLSPEEAEQLVIKAIEEKGS